MSEITREELRKALKQMKNKKTPENDKITCEMLKYGGDNLINSNKCLELGETLTI